jgi:hypothetical protein
MTRLWRQRCQRPTRNESSFFYINYHNEADHDESKDSRDERLQVHHHMKAVYSLVVRKLKPTFVTSATYLVILFPMWSAYATERSYKVRSPRLSRCISQSGLESDRVRYQGSAGLRKELPVMYADHNPALLDLLVLCSLLEPAWLASLFWRRRL